jgi:hypothetical protein
MRLLQGVQGRPPAVASPLLCQRAVALRSKGSCACFLLSELPVLRHLCFVQRVPGVVATAVGYSQGQVENPTYQQVSAHALALG